MKLLVGIPHTGMFPADTVSSLLNLTNPVGTAYMFLGGSLVYKARENIVSEFLKGDYTHLLFIDSDMVFPPDAIIRLYNHDKDIVAGRAHKRVYPYEPCFFKTCNWNQAEIYHNYPSGLIEVAAVGMAFTMIKRKVVEALGEMCFYPTGSIGEDLAFCTRAKEAGFSIWVDTDLEIGHVGTAVYGAAHYKQALAIRSNVNTKEWWEKEHSYNWVNVGINGISQTKYFADVLLNNLDVKLYGDVLDYGCAFGQMTKELSKHANAWGYDFSKTAVEQASQMYPELTFTSELPQRQFDFVVSSNVLEHYSDPVEEMRNELKLAKDYFIAMTPYKDGPNDTHPSRIDEDTFPEEIDGFKRVSVKIVPTTNSSLCYCSQIIFVYRRAA